jgi:hypothetical protein
MLSNTTKKSQVPLQNLTQVPLQPPMQPPQQPPQQQMQPMQSKVPLQNVSQVPLQPEPKPAQPEPNEPSLIAKTLAGVMSELLRMKPPEVASTTTVTKTPTETNSSSGLGTKTVKHKKTPLMGNRSMVSHPKSLIGNEGTDQNAG